MRILCLFGRYAYGDPKRGEGYEYANFWPALASLADEVRLFDTFDRSGYRDFADLNVSLVREVCAFEPDLIFAVLMHYEVWTETLDLIRQHTHAAILHWGTDDSWKYAQFSRFIARHVDVHATTDAAAFDQAKGDGLGNFVLSQWAASAQHLGAPVTSGECQYDVSFIGSAYGNRKEWVEGLEARGITVACFGHGWESGVVQASRIPGIIRRSRISLNFGDSGLQLSGAGLRRSRQIKARAFEVPGAGGLLLTEDAPGLARYFDVGREIAVFASLDELESRIKDLLRQPEARDEMARAGHERVAAEHTYEHRFPPLIEAARRVAALRLLSSSGLDPMQLSGCIRGHKVSGGLQTFGAAARRAATLLLGPNRGPRAARRAMFELGWRSVGDRIYSARGWPGRLFYAES